MDAATAPCTLRPWLSSRQRPCRSARSDSPRGAGHGPGCFDALSARVIEHAGHAAAFVSGFAVAASRLGLPDTGLLSYGESVDHLRSICAATSLPVIADADTGYGNAVNAQRTLLGFHTAGAACVMVEDQRWPKRCGHTQGKEVVDRGEAVARVAAMASVRDAHQLDVLIMARTDAIQAVGLDEALWRSEAFAAAGADLTFVEAPRVGGADAPDLRGLRRLEGRQPGRGRPYPVARRLDAARDRLLDGAVPAQPLPAHHRGDAPGCRRPRAPGRAGFEEARALVGWPEYDETSERFSGRD
ncbi:MAG: isocitrate lyase/PEP mutase family protein [Acidimicrobiales bacterium]